MQRLRQRIAVIHSWLTARRWALLFAILGGLAFALTLDLFYPGFMSRDSGSQLAQARSGAFTDHHPVLMALIWRVTDSIVPGPFGMLVLQSALYWAGLSAIFWVMEGPLLARAVGLLGVGFLLPPFCSAVVVWKDGFMHAAMLAGMACFLLPVGRSRWPRYLLASVFLVLAIGLRHNAAAAVWPLLLLPLCELPLLAGRPRWLRLVLAALMSLALTFGVTVTLQRALAPLARAAHVWQRILGFDLAAISLKTGKLVIDQDTGVVPPGMGLPQIRGQFSPHYENALYSCGELTPDTCAGVFNLLHDERQLSRLARNWLREIRAHPRAYLSHRATFSHRLLRLGPERKMRYFYVSEAPFHPLGGTYYPPARTLRMLDWIDLQQTWVGFSAWIYVLLSCLLLPLTLVRHLRGTSLVPVVYVVSGLSYLLSVLLSAGAPDNRYTVWTILCAVLALAATVVPSLPAAIAEVTGRLGRARSRWRGRTSAP